MQKREHVQCPDTERNSGYETVVSNVLVILKNEFNDEQIPLYMLPFTTTEIIQT